MTAIKHGIDIDHVANEVIEDRERKSPGHGSEKVPVLGVHTTVLNKSINLFEKPANKEASRPGRLGLVKDSPEIEIAFCLRQDTNPHP